MTRRTRAIVVLLLGLTLPALAAAQVRVVGERPDCVHASAVARFGAMAYDHWVHVENACATTMRCSVSTDVNPVATTLELAPGQQRDVATFHGSPASAFVATVACE